MSIDLSSEDKIKIYEVLRAFEEALARFQRHLEAIIGQHPRECQNCAAGLVATYLHTLIERVFVEGVVKTAKTLRRFDETDSGEQLQRGKKSTAGRLADDLRLLISDARKVGIPMTSLVSSGTIDWIGAIEEFAIKRRANRMVPSSDPIN
jgi:hypothetical protein